jgi:hypothetical protein
MVTSRDLKIIELQIGRKPRGVLNVERRCCHGYPKVIQVYPLLEEPFPTTFWLTCPKATKRISEIEHQGYIKKLEKLISQDEALRKRYYKNHRDYIKERWRLLSEEDKDLLQKKGLAQVLKKGIGGIEDFNRLKCLHLHYAHHLARENVIGEWLERSFEIEECPFEKVICLGL